MHIATKFKTRGVYRAVISACALLGAAAPVFAEQPVDLGAVGTTGTGVVTAAENPASAIYQAPTQASLTATQPQSIINQHYIQENASAGSNYTDIISIAPSVVSIDPNGPGMMETQSLTIRGFQDGQYNVTFDGIPWGDSNDFTHHSTSYFMAQDIGNIVVDRGPGDASNIGNATFGGTIAVSSKDPSSLAGITGFGSFGSWNTRLIGAEFDSGPMQNYGDAKAYISYKGFTSDGYLTDSAQRRQNLFFKIEKALADDMMLTVVAMGNKLHQNVPYGSTLAQIQQYGHNYGLSSDPTSQDFYGYNYDNITSDFEYVGLKTHLGSWTVDNKLYTYAYFHDGFATNTPGAGAAANGTVVAGVTLPNDVPGNKMNMNYRSVGDLLRLSEPLGPGQLDLGAWVDYQMNNRMLQNIDWTLGGAPNTAASNGDNGSVFDRQMNDTLTTIQPYAQYNWKATDAWTVTPGVKLASFKRAIDATVLQGTLQPFNGSQTWTKALPALTTRYALSSSWSVYGQYAEGFQAPNMNVFYKANSQPNTLSPEQTKNYQVGTTWATQELTLGADLYKIDFNNLIAPYICNGIYTCFRNVGGVSYNGGELEGTWYLGRGASLYGNYGVNNYSTSDGSVLPNTPRTTAAAGIIYQMGGLYGSLIAKEVGSRYATAQDAAGNNIPLGAYTITNLAMSYKLDPSRWLGKNTRIGLQVNNLFNRNDLYGAFANDQNGAPMFFAIPERSYQMSLSVGL